MNLKSISLLGMNIPVVVLFHVGNVLMIAGTSLFGVSGNVYEWDAENYKLLSKLNKNLVPDFLLVSSSLMVVIGYLLSALRDTYLINYDQVARQRDVLLDLVKTGHGDYYERMNRCMEKFLKDLNANQPENRASLYVPCHQGFFKLGRWSDNPELRPRGEDSVVPKVGVLKKAWELGSAYDNDIPEHTADGANYIAYHVSKWSVPAEWAQGIQMKSRCYAAYAIRDTNDRQIGVLILESLSRERLKEQGLKRRIKPCLEATECVNNFERLFPNNLVSS